MGPVRALARLGQATRKKESDQGLERELCPNRPRIGRNCSAFWFLQKKASSDLGGRRGRMISTPHAKTGSCSDHEATRQARRAKPVAELESAIDRGRWNERRRINADQRPLVHAGTTNKLSGSRNAQRA